jgi:hypothetical protein
MTTNLLFMTTIDNKFTFSKPKTVMNFVIRTLKTNTSVGDSEMSHSLLSFLGILLRTRHDSLLSISDEVRDGMTLFILFYLFSSFSLIFSYSLLFILILSSHKLTIFLSSSFLQISHQCFSLSSQT